MGKFLLIAIILLALIFLVVRKVSKYKFANTTIANSRQQKLEITIPSFILQQLLKKVLISVGTGFLLLLIILFIASKFKIALILLPISIYLIGQFFVFNNHVKNIKNQKLTFDTQNNTLTIKKLNHDTVTIDLSTNNFSLTEVKSVQKNNGILIGYYEMTYLHKKYHVSFLLAENLQNKVFFNKLEQISRNLETKLFPII